MSKSPVVFRTSHHASFHHLDPHGHVNTIHYATFLMEHRFSQMKDVLRLGFRELGALPVTFYTHSLDLQFERAIKLDEEFRIESHVASFEETTCRVAFKFERTRDGKLIASGNLGLTAIDQKLTRVAPWPDEVKNLFFSQN